jgi:FKBP-type peptidyl-prolyl cis-trans isomerase 2
MILFSSFMKKEKLAAIGLVIIIVGALSAYILLTYGEEILENLFGEKKKEIIEIGDCVDVNYIGRLASNNSIFDSSYVDVDNKTEGFPLNIFVSLDIESIPPEGYETYSSSLIEGFMEGLIGLKEGESATIGPIPPEKAYGVKPQVGDVITIPGQTPEDKDLRIDVMEIIENSPMPEDYIPYFGDQNTTIYNLRANYSIGEEIPFYPSWENATFVTKVNETMLWTYTTPPEDQRENFTWIDNVTQSQFWEDASSVTSMDDATIVITHSPEIGATMDYSVDFVGLTTYTVVNLTDDKINVSYVDSEGNISYSEFDRTITITRNESQVILMPYPEEGLEQLLAYLKMLYPDLEYSLDDLAGETLLFEVEIVKVYKTS